MSQFPSYSLIENSLNQTSSINVRKNILNGPNSGDYWFHSKGLEIPDNREEGPFPIQGNIGSLLKQEQYSNYSLCSNNISIGGAPNCTGVFNADIYTTSNSCGDNCNLSVPESFGIQSFGMEKDKLTNVHGLHAYKNVRAAVEGRGPSDDYGCYEWIPTLQKTPGNSCTTNYNTYESSTVGNWTQLPQAQSILGYKYTQ